MVGREQELEALVRAAGRAREGDATTVLVLGEAGVGKTRLAAELVGALDDSEWLCATSHGVALAGGELPYGGASELVRSVVKQLGAPEVRRRVARATRPLGWLAPTLSDVPGRPPERGELFGAVLSLIEELRRPVCWVLDDLQWMDTMTQDLVAYLARVPDRTPLLLLGTVRTDPTQPTVLPGPLAELGRVAHVLGLIPLTREQVAAQVAGLGAGALSLEDVARICEVSDGLPFFVEQLVREGGQVTGSLRTVLHGSLTQLSADAHVVLAAAAVGEGLATSSHLRSVCALGDGFDDALAEVRTRGVLLPDAQGDQLRFRHALLREAVDAGLLVEERVLWHRAWAGHIDQAIQTEPHDLRLLMERGRHRYAVGGAEAFPAVLASARAADEVQDDAVRARWWARALEVWPAHPDPTRRLERDGALARYFSALWAVGGLETLVDVLDIESADETDWLRDLWLRLSRQNALRALQLDFTPTLSPDEAEATLRAIRSLPQDFRATEVLARLADEWQSDLPELAGEMLREVVSRADPATDSEAVRLAFAMLGWLETCRGNPEGEVEHARACVGWMSRHHRAGVLDARVSLALSLIAAGRYAESQALGSDNLVDIRDARLHPHLWGAQHIISAIVLLHVGEWDGADEHLDLARGGAIGGDIESAWHLIAGLTRARRGDVSTARSHLEAIPSPPPGTPAGIRWSSEAIRRTVLLGEIATADSDSAGLRSACRELVELSHESDPPDDLCDAYVQVLRWTLLRGATDPDSVDVVTEVAALIDRTRNSSGLIVPALRAEMTIHLHRVADEDDVDAWADVARLWSAAGRVYDAASCRIFEAECALRDDDLARAREVLSKAHSAATRIGAEPLRRVVESTARRGHISGVRASLALAPGLTARETEVLALLAEGRSNAEIASELVMSVKTASVHVSHIITKLGVANRTEAAAHAFREGLLAR